MPKTLTELYNEKMRSIDEHRSRIPVLDLTTPGRTYSELMETPWPSGSSNMSSAYFAARSRTNWER